VVGKIKGSVHAHHPDESASQAACVNPAALHASSFARSATVPGSVLALPTAAFHLTLFISNN